MKDSVIGTSTVDASHDAAGDGGSHVLLTGGGAHVDSDDADYGYVVGVGCEGDDVEVGPRFVVGDLELDGSNVGGVSVVWAREVERS